MEGGPTSGCPKQESASEYPEIYDIASCDKTEINIIGELVYISVSKVI